MDQLVNRFYERRETDLASDLILFDRNEIQLLIEMHLAQRRFLDHSMIELALDFHHEEEHVIVWFSWEEDLAGVELVECTADWPDIDGCIVG
jgi:hypothetical protein